MVTVISNWGEDWGPAGVYPEGSCSLPSACSLGLLGEAGERPDPFSTDRGDQQQELCHPLNVGLEALLQAHLKNK